LAQCGIGRPGDNPRGIYAQTGCLCYKVKHAAGLLLLQNIFMEWYALPRGVLTLFENSGIQVKKRETIRYHIKNTIVPTGQTIYWIGHPIGI